MKNYGSLVKHTLKPVNIDQNNVFFYSVSMKSKAFSRAKPFDVRGMDNL